MDRLEEIKGRIENYKSEYLPFFENNGDMHEWNAMFGDIQYLLSKLSIAENELNKIRQLTDVPRNPNEEIINQKAAETLQMIRE